MGEESKTMTGEEEEIMSTLGVGCIRMAKAYDSVAMEGNLPGGTHATRRLSDHVLESIVSMRHGSVSPTESSNMPMDMKKMPPKRRFSDSSAVAKAGISAHDCSQKKVQIMSRPKNIFCRGHSEMARVAPEKWNINVNNAGNDKIVESGIVRSIDAEILNDSEIGWDFSDSQDGSNTTVGSDEGERMEQAKTGATSELEEKKEEHFVRECSSETLNGSGTGTEKLCDSSFVDVLRESVEKNCSKVFATWYDSKGNASDSYTYQGLWNEAGFIAHYLRVVKNIEKGQRVVLCYTPGLQFFAAFLGCIRAGIVAVPIYPPDPRKLEVGIQKMKLVCRDCNVSLVLCDAKLNKLMMFWKLKNKFSNQDFKSLFRVHPKVPKKWTTSKFEDSSISDEDLAFLQYTSGSTGDPKGVMITLRALRANTKSIVEDACTIFRRSNKSSDDIVSFSWLPQYHDMGLIYATIAPIVGGWSCHMMSPIDFLLNPVLWIKLMSELKVTSTSAPNFAFQLTARKFRERREKNPYFGADFDLSQVTLLGVAAEPIQSQTIAMFAETFSECGLKKTSFVPGYGLAESVVYVSSLQEFKVSNENQFVAVGSRSDIREGQVIKIVCPVTKEEVPDGEEGEIWVAGPSIANGYWGKRDLSIETFQASVSSSEKDKNFLRTGDLGFFEDGYLFVCGRQKDVIIVNGRNFFPQDIEASVQQASDGVRPGCVAAFSSDDGGGSGSLEIIFELYKSHEKQHEEVIEAVRDAVVTDVSLTPKRIVAIKERCIMKTTSGKIQRRKNRETLHTGGFAKYILYDSDTLQSCTANNDSTTLEDADPKESSYGFYAASFQGSVNEASSSKQENLILSWDEVAREVENSVSDVLSSKESLDLSKSLMDSGLDSMGISELAFSLESRFGIQLSSELLFHPIKDIVDNIYNSLDTDKGDNSHVSPDERSPFFSRNLTSIGGFWDAIPESSNLTSHEQRMLFIHENNPTSNSYHLVFSEQFHPTIDVRSNLSIVLDCLPTLQTRFVSEACCTDTKPVIGDMTNASDYDILKFLFHPFNLSSGPLCRFGFDSEKNIVMGSLHHSIADGRSIKILLEAIANGCVKESTKKFTPRKYAGYEALPEVQGKYSLSRDKWKKIMGDTPERLQIEFASPCLARYNNILKLNNTTKLRLQTLCRREGVSMFILALSILHHSLRAYSHDPYAMGVAFDVRPHQFRDSIGMFVNTVLFPFPGGKKGGEEDLKCLQRRWAKEVLPNASTPYDVLASMGYGCNVYLAFNAGIVDIDEKFSSEIDSSFDLTVSWWDDKSNDGFAIFFQSGVGSWPGLEERFLQVINAMLVDSHGKPPLDPLLSTEKNLVLHWGKGESSPVHHVCLHQMFEKQAQSNPSSIALWDKKCSISMTYEELDRRSTFLALELQSRGAKPDMFVGLLMSGKSFELFVALFGILKSGAAYVPMDCTLYPPERIRFIMEDTSMNLLVTSKKHEDFVNSLHSTSQTKFVFVEDSSNFHPSNQPSESELLHNVVPQSYAYMIYTSGTTGQPKGVVCNHIGPVNMISSNWFLKCGVPGKDIVGCSAPVVFDGFVGDCLGSLCSGLSLSIDLKHCTMAFCTPSVANILMSDETNSIEKLLTGGEACIQGLEDRCTTFQNVYGPTECSVWAVASHRSDSIGRPLPNVLCYVVHPDDGTLCPPGVSGELWIGGVGVSIGYHNRPKLTAEKFIPNPFGSSNKVYKTGDRVKWNMDGELVFLGRFDNQVKVRGYRIELGEIQAALEKQEYVSSALVVVYDEKLVAYVTIEGEVDEAFQKQELDDLGDFEASLKAKLKALSSLPSYMIPWKIMVLDELPLTSNGKIDRKRLPSPDDTSKTPFVPPRSSAEKMLCRLFQKILHIERVGIDCSFVDLGGHSLQMMQCVLEIRNYFNIDSYSVRQFVEHSTPRKIAKDIAQQLLVLTEERGSMHNDELNLLDTNEMLNTEAKSRVRIFSELLTKMIGILLLGTCLGASSSAAGAVFTAIISTEVHSSFTLRENYLKYVGAISASIATLFSCIFVLAWVFCTLLQFAFGKSSKVIKRTSFQYAIWYTFQKLWFIVSVIADTVLGGTLFYSWFYRAYGANIGRSNLFEDVKIHLPFMLTTGNNVVIETGAKLETVSIQKNGDVVLGNVVLGNDVVIGANAHIGLGARLGNSVFIKALSVVSIGSIVPDRSTCTGTTIEVSCRGWNSSSSKSINHCDPDASFWCHLASAVTKQLPYVLSFGYGIIAVFATLKLFEDLWGSFVFFFICYPVILAMGQCALAISVRLMRFALNRGQADTRSTRLFSRLFLRRYLSSKLYQSTVSLTEGTIISRLAGKLLGADLDLWCGFTPHPEEPDLTSTGKNVFAANGVKLRNFSFRPGSEVHFGRIGIGVSSMILDRSVVDPSTNIKNNVVIGSITHVTEATPHSDGSLLMGNPALPTIGANNASSCQEAKTITSESTTQSLLMYFIVTYFGLVVRASILVAICSFAFVDRLLAGATTDHSMSVKLSFTFLAAPLACLSLIVWLLILSILSKCLIVHTFQQYEQQGVIDVRSWKVFRWHVCNYLLHMSCTVPLQFASEFWLTAMFWKVMGAEIGKQSKIDSSVLLFEADLLKIGSNCRVEDGATLLCHKFTNGGLELAPISVPSNSYIGSRSVVLPGSKISDEHVTLMPLTLVSPGDNLTVGIWRGSPAEMADTDPELAETGKTGHRSSISSSVHSQILSSSIRRKRLAERGRFH